jgi:hypothetical protein
MTTFRALHAAIQVGGCTDEIRVLSALNVVRVLFTLVAVQTVPTVRRGLLGPAVLKAMTDEFNIISLFTIAQVRALLPAIVQHARLYEEEDLPIAIGAVYITACVLYVHENAVSEANDVGLFAIVRDLHRHLCTTPMTADWWISTSREVNSTACLLCMVWCPPAVCSKYLTNEELRSSSWWPYVRQEAIRMIKLCSLAGLFSLEAWNTHTCCMAIQILERTARDVSQHALLFEAGIMDALEELTVNSVESVAGVSASAYAAGTLVALVGQNEGGKTLSRASVLAVLPRALLP